MAQAGSFKLTLKRTLARVLHPLERLIDRVKTRAPKDPVIAGYLGYATPETIVLRGRVLSAVVRRNPDENDSKWTNFLAMLRLFATDEVADVTVRAGEQVAQTDEEGYFSLVLPRADQSGWFETEVVLDGSPDVCATLCAQVPAPDARFGVVSDIDDTVLETGAYTLLKNLWTSMTGNALTRHIFPDAKALLDRLHDGRNPVFFVSSSPWNIFDFLRAVFERHGVLRAPMFLRDLGLSETQFITGTHGGHKGAAIDTILAANPDLPFVLIGDTGQEDAHVYLNAFRRHPGRIIMVVLREPGLGPDAASETAIAEMKRAGLDVQTGRDFSAVTAPTI